VDKVAVQLTASRDAMQTTEDSRRTVIQTSMVMKGELNIERSK
jgi:hypothetical protein